MHASRLFASLALGCVLAAGAARAAPPDEPVEVALKRINLLVRDLDRSLAIYRDILGFRVYQISESTPQSYSYPVFQLPAKAKLRFATLDSSTETRALALTEVTGIELPAAPAIAASAPVIRINRLDEVLSRLRATGLRVVEPNRSKTPEGRAFSEMAFTDPDGHVVVLYQLD